MMKKILFLALLLGLCLGSAAMADLVDDFDVAHDYVADGVTGTDWSGLLNSSYLTTLDASTTLEGELYLASTGGYWSADGSSGPFLYKEVTGDFVVEMKADDANWEDYACGGLLVRNPNATSGEDNFIVAYWPCSGWGFDNLVWSTDDDTRTESDVSQNDAPYLKVERLGGDFYLYYSSDGEDWTLFSTGDPLVRDDMDVETLQIGLFQSYADWAGQSSYYEYFNLMEQVTDFSGTTTVAEGGTGVTITVDLIGPTHTDQVDVVISEVTSGDPNDLLFDGSLCPFTLSFPVGVTQQTFTLQAVDDLLQEGPEIIELSAEVVSDDSNYADHPTGSATINVIDNEAGLLVDEGDGISVDEDGTVTDTLSITLTAEPAEDVTVTFTTDGQVTVTSPLVFTSENWDTAQTATVAAVDDSDLEDDPHTGTISFTVTSDDEDYDGVTAFDVEVSIAENECGAWGYSAYDYNEDCVVNLIDLAELASEWSQCTMPYETGCVDVR